MQFLGDSGVNIDSVFSVQNAGVRRLADSNLTFTDQVTRAFRASLGRLRALY